MRQWLLRWLGVSLLVHDIALLRRETHEDHHRLNTRFILLEKEILDMAADLTNLVVQIVALEAVAQQVLAKLAEPGTSQADIDAAAARVRVVADSLTAAVAPLQP